MSLTFDEATHTYMVDGRVMPSVTQILEVVDRGLWRVPPDVLEAARLLGTAVHKATELYDLDDLDASSVAPQVAPYLAAWVKFRRESGFRPTSIEHRLYNPVYGYCGTLDRVGQLNDKTSLVDVKSGVAWPSHGPQTAAYAAAVKEQEGVRVDARYAVYLGADGTYRLVEHADRADWPTFLACLTVHRFTKGK